MDAMTMQAFGDAFDWLGQLVPFLLAPMVLLLLWEVLVLLAAVLGMLSESRKPIWRAHRRRLP